MLDSLKKALTERALNAEMDHHLASDGGVGNTRNGCGRKTVMTEIGKLAIEVRAIASRASTRSCSPSTSAAFRASMYARGMSTREIVGHLHELYGIDVSPDLISTVLDAVLDEVSTWQQRPLDPVYPLVL